MNIWQAMNQLLKQDIIDLGKVGGLNGFTYTLVKNQDILHFNKFLQEAGTSLLIILTVFYTLFKAVNMFRHMRWAKQDRLRDIINEDEDNNQSQPS